MNMSLSMRPKKSHKEERICEEALKLFLRDGQVLPLRGGVFLPLV